MPGKQLIAYAAPGAARGGPKQRAGTSTGWRGCAGTRRNAALAMENVDTFLFNQLSLRCRRSRAGRFFSLQMQTLCRNQILLAKNFPHIKNF